MATSQAGIFQELARFHRHLEYQLAANVTAPELTDFIKAVNEQSDVVVGFGKSLWAQLQPQTQPEQLKAFADIGPAKTTQGDTWLWVFGDDHSEVIDKAAALHALLAPLCSNTVETEGEQYHQSRDRTGFEDGSGNPKTPEARLAAACIPEGEKGAGGSYVLTQKWRHALHDFSALAETEQEQIIGRTKADAIELTGEAMPKDSHVSRTDLKVDGVAQKVWRRSVPWGGVIQQGLYFVGFACELSRLEVQLEHMFGLTNDGIQDRLTEFSSPIRSAWWFAPSAELLRELATNPDKR